MLNSHLLLSNLIFFLPIKKEEDYLQYLNITVCVCVWDLFNLCAGDPCVLHVAVVVTSASGRARDPAASDQT